MAADSTMSPETIKAIQQLNLAVQSMASVVKSLEKSGSRLTQVQSQQSKKLSKLFDDFEDESDDYLVQQAKITKGYTKLDGALRAYNNGIRSSYNAVKQFEQSIGSSSKSLKGQSAILSGMIENTNLTNTALDKFTEKMFSNTKSLSLLSNQLDKHRQSSINYEDNLNSLARAQEHLANQANYLDNALKTYGKEFDSTIKRIIAAEDKELDAGELRLKQILKENNLQDASSKTIKNHIKEVKREINQLSELSYRQHKLGEATDYVKDKFGIFGKAMMGTVSPMGLVAAGFGLLASAIPQAFNQFKILADSSMVRAALDVKRAQFDLGLSFEHATKLFQENARNLAGTGNFKSFVKGLNQAQEGFMKLGVNVEESAQLASDIRKNMVEGGVNIKDLEHFNKAVTVQTSAFSKLRATTGLSAEEFRSFNSEMMNNASVQEQLNGLNEEDRLNKITDMNKLRQNFINLGMSAQQAQKAMLSIQDIGKQKVTDRFTQAAKIQQMASIAGLDNASELADIYRKGKRATAEEKTRLQQGFGKMAKVIDSAGKGSYAMEHAMQTLGEGLPENLLDSGRQMEMGADAQGKLSGKQVSALEKQMELADETVKTLKMLSRADQMKDDPATKAILGIFAIVAGLGAAIPLLGKKIFSGAQQTTDAILGIGKDIVSQLQVAENKISSSIKNGMQSVREQKTTAVEKSIARHNKKQEARNTKQKKSRDRTQASPKIKESISEKIMQAGMPKAFDIETATINIANATILNANPPEEIPERLRWRPIPQETPKEDEVKQHRVREQISEEKQKKPERNKQKRKKHKAPKIPEVQVLEESISSLDKFKSFFSSLGDFFKPLKSIGAVASKASHLAKFIPIIGTAFTALTDGLSGFLDAEEIFNIDEAFGQSATIQQKLLAGVGGIIKGMLFGFGDEWVNSLLISADNTINEIMDSQAITDFLDVWRKGVKTFSAIFDSIVGGISSLGSYVGSLIGSVDTSWVSAGGNIIGSIFSGIVHIIGDFFDDLNEFGIYAKATYEKTGIFLTGIVDGLKNTYNSIGRAFDSAWNMVSTTWYGIVEKMYDFLNTVSGGTLFEEELANAIKKREQAELIAKQVEESNKAEVDSYKMRAKQREERSNAIDVETANNISKYHEEENLAKEKITEERKQAKIARESQKELQQQTKNEVKNKEAIVEDVKKSIKTSEDFNKKLVSLNGLSKQSLYNDVQSSNAEQLKKAEEKQISQPQKIIEHINNTSSLGILSDPSFISSNINEQLSKIKQPSIEPIKADVNLGKIPSIEPIKADVNLGKIPSIEPIKADVNLGKIPSIEPIKADVNLGKIPSIEPIKADVNLGKIPSIEPIKADVNLGKIPSIDPIKADVNLGKIPSIDPIKADVNLGKIPSIEPIKADVNLGKIPSIEPIKAKIEPDFDKKILEPIETKKIVEPEVVNKKTINEPKNNKSLSEPNLKVSDSEQKKEKTLEQLMNELNDNLNKLIILNTDSNSINTKQLDLIDSLVAVNTQAHDYYVSRTTGNLGMLKFGQMNTNPKGAQLAQI